MVPVKGAHMHQEQPPDKVTGKHSYDENGSDQDPGGMIQWGLFRSIQLIR